MLKIILKGAIALFFLGLCSMATAALPPCDLIYITNDTGSTINNIHALWWSGFQDPDSYWDPSIPFDLGVGKTYAFIDTQKPDLWKNFIVFIAGKREATWEFGGNFMTLAAKITGSAGSYTVKVVAYSDSFPGNPSSKETQTKA